VEAQPKDVFHREMQRINVAIRKQFFANAVRSATSSTPRRKSTTSIRVVAAGRRDGVALPDECAIAGRRARPHAA